MFSCQSFRRNKTLLLRFVKKKEKKKNIIKWIEFINIKFNELSTSEIFIQKTFSVLFNAFARIVVVLIIAFNIIMDENFVIVGWNFMWLRFLWSLPWLFVLCAYKNYSYEQFYGRTKNASRLLAFSFFLFIFWAIWRRFIIWQVEWTTQNNFAKNQ